MAFRVVFLGSPDLGVPCLQALHGAEGIEICRVLTLPDARRSRRGHATATPVGRAALELGLPLTRWEKGRRLEIEETLRADRPDAAVVIAFARILKKSFLEIPRLGCLNLHASLLPWGRGASPIQQAILEGLDRSGWSAMLMDEGLDTGPVLARESLEIGPRWNSGDLYAALKASAPNFLMETLGLWRGGSLVPEPQGEEGASYAGKISAAAGAMDWSLAASELDRHVRAYTPSPGAWCRREERRLRVLEAEPVEGSGPPGEILDAGPGRLRVACGEGALDLLCVQAEGTRPMAIDDYLRGRPLPPGRRLERG